MTDAPPQAPATPAQPTGDTLTSPPKDSKAQMVTALATVAALTLIALAGLVIAALCRNVEAVVVAALALPTTVVGALANSLTAPSGLSALLPLRRAGGAS